MRYGSSKGRRESSSGSPVDPRSSNHNSIPQLSPFPALLELLRIFAANNQLVTRLSTGSARAGAFREAVYFAATFRASVATSPLRLSGASTSAVEPKDRTQRANHSNEYASNVTTTPSPSTFSSTSLQDHSRRTRSIVSGLNLTSAASNLPS